MTRRTWTLVLVAILLTAGLWLATGPTPRTQSSCKVTLAQYDKGPVTPCP